MKYIDAEKLKKAIEDKGLDCSFALKMERLDTLTLIDSLQQEQPSLPSNLDEAALKELQAYLPQGNGPDGICYFIAPQMLAMYKAGAELMAGQGVTKEAVIGMATEEISINVSQQTLNELDLCPGDKVVVQIRKK